MVMDGLWFIPSYRHLEGVFPSRYCLVCIEVFPGRYGPVRCEKPANETARLTQEKPGLGPRIRGPPSLGPRIQWPPGPGPRIQWPLKASALEFKGLGPQWPPKALAIEVKGLKPRWPPHLSLETEVTSVSRPRAPQSRDPGHRHSRSSRSSWSSGVPGVRGYGDGWFMVHPIVPASRRGLSQLVWSRLHRGLSRPVWSRWLREAGE
jgi:hypothetical protein